jgi:hypothetical protein
VLLLDHVHHVEAAAEDGNGEGPQHRLSVLVEGDFGQGLGNVAGHGEELVLAERLLDEIAENSKGTVELGIGASGDDGEDAREQVLPLLGVVMDRDLANNITSGRRDVSLEGK